MDFPIEHGDFPVRYVTNYQRVKSSQSAPHGDVALPGVAAPAVAAAPPPPPHRRPWRATVFVEALRGLHHGYPQRMKTDSGWWFQPL